MSVHRRTTKTGVVFDVRWRDAAGRNRGRVFDDQDDATAFDLAQRRAKRMGAFAPADPSPELLSNFLERWLRTGQWRQTTRTQRAQLMDRWIDPYIGNVSLRELGRARVREFRADIVRDGSPPVNTNNVMAVLSAALTIAVDDGLIPVNPCYRLGKVPTQKPQRRAYPPDVTRKLLAKMPTDRDRAVFQFLLTGGLRPGEIVAMQWQDIDDDVMTVYDTIQAGDGAPTKTDVFRSVPVEPPLRRALDKLPQGSPTDLVITGDRGGPLNWKMWTRRVWGDAKRAVGTDAVPYSMRHTRASVLIVDRGMDVATAAAWMGHSPRVMLDHYVHLFQKSQMRSAKTGRARGAQRAA